MSKLSQARVIFGLVVAQVDKNFLFRYDAIAASQKNPLKLIEDYI
jgi:hypothetical protein